MRTTGDLWATDRVHTGILRQMPGVWSPLASALTEYGQAGCFALRALANRVQRSVSPSFTGVCCEYIPKTLILTNPNLNITLT